MRPDELPQLDTTWTALRQNRANVSGVRTYGVLEAREPAGLDGGPGLTRTADLTLISEPMCL